MDTEPPAAADAAWSAAIAAAVLRRGAMVHTVSLILAGVAVLVGGAARADVTFLAAAGVIVVLAAVEFWLASRVALDADLFDALAARHTDLAGFDRAMLALRLMPPDKAGRPLDARISGAFRLLKLQTLTLGLQMMVLVGFLLWV